VGATAVVPVFCWFFRCNDDFFFVDLLSGSLSKLKYSLVQLLKGEIENRLSLRAEH